MVPLLLPIGEPGTGRGRDGPITRDATERGAAPAARSVPAARLRCGPMSSATAPGPVSGDRPVTVSVLAPPQLVGQDAADRLRAARPELDVHLVPYVETNEHRAARRTGRLHEVTTPLPELADEHRRCLAASVAVLALDVPSELTDLAPGLRLVHAAGAGTEWFDHAGLEAMGIPLCNASGVAAAPIAEFMLGRILEVYKDLRRIEAQQREHRWAPYFGRELSGSTLGIVGLGGIGRAVAVRARAFGVTVLGTRRSARAGDVDPDVDELWPLDRLDEMLGRCDIVLLAAPAGPETDDMFDAARFAAMKPGSLFCNVARGSLVVETALLDALALRSPRRRGARRGPPRAGAARRPPVGRAERVPVAALLVVDGPLRRAAHRAVRRQPRPAAGRRGAAQRGQRRRPLPAPAGAGLSAPRPRALRAR